MNRDEKYNCIRQLPFFARFAQSLLVDILDLFTVSAFRKGKYLFYQGDKANFAFYHVSGCVRKEKYCGENSMVLGDYTINTWFGLEEVLLAAEYFNDALTLRDSILLVITHYNLKQLLKEPQIKDSILQEVLNNFRIIESAINNDSPDKRIARYLLEVVQNRQSPDIMITQEQLSEALNITRETVNRYLKKMEGDELLKLGRGKITIMEEERLQELLR